MNRIEKLQQLRGEMEKHKSLFDKYEAEYLKTVELEEKDISFLIQEFENKDSELVKKEITDDSYEYILGGDGRSAPWSEKRGGKVLNISFLTDFYISDHDFGKFKEYLKATQKVVSVKINTIQIFP